MKNEHVLSGLKKKRDELRKALLYHRTELQRTMAGMDSLDATVRLCDPDYVPGFDYNRDLGKVNRWLRKGEKPVLILDYFREKGGVLATTEIINHLAAHKGLSRDMVGKEQYNAGLKSLQQMGKKGTITEDHRDRGVIYWRLA